MSRIHVLSVLLSVALGAAKDEAVVFTVDPTWDDVAAYVTKIPLLQQYKIVKVVTSLGALHHYIPTGPIDIYKQFVYGSLTPNVSAAASEICPKLKSLGIPIAAVIPASDGAIRLSDRLAACIGVRGNPAFGPLAAARHDKWVMAEAVRKAGLRVAKQQRVGSWAEAETYLESLQPPLSRRHPVVFKILEGPQGGGKGVTKVNNLAEAKTAFGAAASGKPPNREQNVKILIMEYLQGKNYAVDSVSRDGVHKVVTVWFADFREANGVFDQYFGFKVLDPTDSFSKVLIKYTNNVLDATGLRNGAANTEVQFLEDENEPCLVEVNPRWAGFNWGDGLAVEDATVGRDQYGATITAYLDQARFDQMPDVLPMKQNGAIVSGINYRAGILTGIPGLDAVKKYPSYVTSNLQAAHMGKWLPLTTPSTVPFGIALAHKEKAVVDADYDRIIELEKKNAFFDTLQVRQGFAYARDYDGVTLATSYLGNKQMLMLVIIVCGMLAIAMILTARRWPDAGNGAAYLILE